MAKETTIVCDKMQTMETRITSQTKNVATYATDKVARALKK